MAQTPLEKTYYPIVERWLLRHHRCFDVRTNRGLIYGRIDVIGIRDVGGDLSGDVEAIAVEVKRGMTPFTKAAGQAVGYKVYADRVYLADVRKKPFTEMEIAIASNLGIGLIAIRERRCREVLSSPVYAPIKRLQLQLFKKLDLGKCQFCGSTFRLGEPQVSTWSRVCDSNLKLSIKRGKGLLFVLDEVERRKLGKLSNDHLYGNFRFVCPDCVANVLAPLQCSE